MQRKLPTEQSLFPDLEAPAVRRRKVVPVSGSRGEAQALLQEWYEERTPRPRVAHWVGARRVIERFLDDWSADQVRIALRSCDCVSYGWLEPQLRRIANATKGPREIVRAEVPDFVRPSDVDFGY